MPGYIHISLVIDGDAFAFVFMITANHRAEYKMISRSSHLGNNQCITIADLMFIGIYLRKYIAGVGAGHIHVAIAVNCNIIEILSGYCTNICAVHQLRIND